MFPRSTWEIDRGNVTVGPLFPGPKMDMADKGTMTRGPVFPRTHVPQVETGRYRNNENHFYVPRAFCSHVLGS